MVYLPYIYLIFINMGILYVPVNILGGGNSNIFYVQPEPWGNVPI